MDENIASTLGAAMTESAASTARAIPFEDSHRLLLMLLLEAADTSILLDYLLAPAGGGE